MGIQKNFFMNLFVEPFFFVILDARDNGDIDDKPVAGSTIYYVVKTDKNPFFGSKKSKFQNFYFLPTQGPPHSRAAPLKSRISRNCGSWTENLPAALMRGKTVASKILLFHFQDETLKIYK